MKYTTNLKLKKLDYTDLADIADINDNMDKIDEEISSHKAESVIQTAGGTATAITVSTGGNFTYAQGKTLKFKATADNGAVATTINIDSKGAKNIKKLDGSVPTIKNGKVYEIYFDVTGDCFFLLARAEGDATVGNVLAGKIFSNGDDTGLVGTAPLKSGITYIPTTSDQVISTGFEDGTCKVKGDANLIASNILSGKSIFGVSGELTSTVVGDCVVFDSTTAVLAPNSSINIKYKLKELKVNISKQYRVKCVVRGDNYPSQTCYQFYKNGNPVGNVTTISNSLTETTMSMDMDLKKDDTVQVYGWKVITCSYPAYAHNLQLCLAPDNYNYATNLQ